MLKIIKKESPIFKLQIDKKIYQNLYKSIITPRLIEEKMLNLLRQGKLSKWFSGIGQEAISVGATKALRANDTIFTMHRNLGVFTSRNIPLKNLFGQIIGNELGFTKGRDRSFHFGAPEYNIIGMISHLAAMLPVACGVGLGYKLKKQNRIALAFIGDGATSEGDFHEALNLAAVWKLPVIFLIENNGYGLSTPTYEQYLCKNLADRAIGYGIKGETIDGNDIELVYNTIQSYAEKIRKTPEPILIEAETFRIRQLYTDAASAYLEGYQKYPKGEKAPINLLKLGVSMVQIGEKDQGCKMINGVENQYPDANQSVIQKAKYESQKFECNKQNS